MLGTWFFFPLLQRFSRHQKLLKDHFSKLPREKKFRHSPTYSISDFTRKCRRSGNGHNWDYYWHQKARGPSFLYPGLSWKSHITYLGDLPTEQNRSPFDSLYSQGTDNVKRREKQTPLPVKGSYATKKPPNWSLASSDLPESQELPASEASHGEKEELKCRLFWQFR